ncbi:hypothetical protein SKAU_G00233360 [Synaphobranchus kaupii]|uniref:Uncharacterized protein n=1 Tax=Synaphobranchus kaupii TaxID=118154 RepID=A0A9Q1F674_SYNKA|nr:hypothetical protein SKAU_G00233360 [Synaphobranchus kaupii]
MFKAGNFTIQKTNRVFSAIPIDQAHAQNNACIKSDGGVVGLTDNPSGLRRWMVACPEVATLIEDFEDAHQLMVRRDVVLHHDQTASVQKAFRKDVHSLVNIMEELCNRFKEESENLLVLDSKEIADPSAVETVKKAQKISRQQFQAFTEECLVKRTKPIDDTIHRNRLKLFVSSMTNMASKEKQQQTSMKRRLRLGTKSDLLTCLEDLSPAQTKAPDATCVILDGAAIIQMMKPAGANTFDEYTQQVFIPYISSQLRSVSRVDLIWDTYKDDSLKGTARAKRGKGVRRRVVGKAAIPGNWHNFLWVDSNKTELFSFLSMVLLQSFCEGDKEAVLTDGKGVLSTQLLQDLDTLAPCSREEADSCMLLHASHATQHGHHQMFIHIVDTDVVVLTVFAASQLPAGCELWLAFGTGKSFRYLAAHQIAACLGPEMSCALPMFHALTGFAGHGKKTVWSTWKSVPEVIWGKTLLPDSALPSPTDWGWVKTEGMYEPHWTTLPQASKPCHELISCSCKSGCRKRCRCKKAALQCTGLCFCEGECAS